MASPAASFITFADSFTATSSKPGFTTYTDGVTASSAPGFMTLPDNNAIVNNSDILQTDRTEYYEDLKYYYAMAERGKQIWLKGSPALMVVGTLGNILSIVVLSRKNLRRSNTAIYLIVLAVTDILVLYTGLLRQWLLYLGEGDIRQKAPAVCKIHLWLTYSTLDISVWVIVALTFERLISVYWPHRVKRYCTAVTSLVALGIIGALLLAVNSHFLYGFGNLHTAYNLIHPRTNQTLTVIHKQKCHPLWDEYGEWQRNTWPWVDLCLYSLVPLSLIIVFNVAIVVKVLIRRRARRVGHSDNPSAMQVTVQNRQLKKVSSMTAILVVLTLVLLASTMPISVYFIIQPYLHRNSDRPLRVNGDLKVVFAIVNMLAYTNHSINFLLYCMSGSRFREELLAVPLHLYRRLFRGGVQGRTSNNTTLTTDARTSRTRSRVTPANQQTPPDEQHQQRAVSFWSLLREAHHRVRQQQQQQQTSQQRSRLLSPEDHTGNEIFTVQLQQPQRNHLRAHDTDRSLGLRSHDNGHSRDLRNHDNGYSHDQSTA